MSEVKEPPKLYIAQYPLFLVGIVACAATTSAKGNWGYLLLQIMTVVGAELALRTVRR